jgi:hypothetical protein
MGRMYKPLVFKLHDIYLIVAKKEDNMDKKKMTSRENSKMLRQENVEKLKLLFTGIQAIGIIMLVISVLLAYRSYIDANKWKRYDTAYDLLKRFKQFENFRDKLRNYFPEMDGNFPKNYTPLSIDEFKEIDKQRGEVKIKGKKYNATFIRENLVKIYNFFEDVAYAYNKGLADRELIEKSLKHIILRIDEIFSNYREAVKYRDEDNPIDNWPPITELIDEWKNEK